MKYVKRKEDDCIHNRGQQDNIVIEALGIGSKLSITGSNSSSGRHHALKLGAEKTLQQAEVTSSIFKVKSIIKIINEGDLEEKKLEPTGQKW